MSNSREEYVFNLFKEKYQEFPLGQCTRGEQPDYIITSGQTMIGIEITQIFVDNYVSSSLNQKRKESLRSMLGERLCEKIQSVMPFKFILSIDFNSKDFSKNEIDENVLNCINYLKKLPFPETFVSIDIDNLGQLPDVINGINFFQHPSLKKSFYSECAGGVLPDLTMQHLQIVLDKKHKSLKKYRQCKEHWLLIEEDTFLADSFGEITTGEFKTDFQKVFLYRHSKGELLQLR